MDYTYNIKQKINKLLEEKSWSKSILAERSGIPKQTVYNNLDKDIEIKLSTLNKISIAFGISMTYWFESEENMVNDVSVEYKRLSRIINEDLHSDLIYFRERCVALEKENKDLKSQIQIKAKQAG
jgi:transcriptional regulator with XRE-family HTH domain